MQVFRSMPFQIENSKAKIFNLPAGRTKPIPSYQQGPCSLLLPLAILLIQCGEVKLCRNWDTMRCKKREYKNCYSDRTCCIGVATSENGIFKPLPEFSGCAQNTLVHEVYQGKILQQVILNIVRTQYQTSIAMD